MNWWPFKPGHTDNYNPPPKYARPPMPAYPISPTGLRSTTEMIRRWQANTLIWPEIDPSMLPLKEDKP